MAALELPGKTTADTESCDKEIRSYIENLINKQNYEQTYKKQEEEQKQKRKEDKFVRNSVYKRRERVVFNALSTIVEEEEEGDEIKIKKKKVKLPKLVKMKSSIKKKGAKIKKQFKKLFS